MAVHLRLERVERGAEGLELARLAMDLLVGGTRARVGGRVKGRVGTACGAPTVVCGGEEGREVRIAEEGDAQLEGAPG